MTADDVHNVLAWAWPWIATGLATLLALTTSIHALLTKRDPRAMVVWVGFVWLVPVVGSILYGIFGINRIKRSAQRLRLRVLRYGPGGRPASEPATPEWLVLPAAFEHLRSLSTMIGRLSSRRLTFGNSVWPLRDGDIAYPEMLAAIGAAKRSVSLSTYIFDRDEAGLRFVAALAGAIARGVEVRVLIDDLGVRYSWPTVRSVLQRAGVPVATFLPVFSLRRMTFMNLRSHRKILVVDGSTGFTGGMNIRAGHVVRGAASGVIHDVHFRLNGPVVTHLQEVFAEDWHFATAEALQGDAWFPVIAPAGSVMARGLVDGPDEDIDPIEWAILGAVASARHSVKVMTPYFLPDSALIAALSVAAMRGVEVDVLLPSLNNLPFVQWAANPLLPRLLEHGCRLWYTRPPFDHSKVMVVDDYWSMIGSSNWDPRALRLNFEFNVECYDEGLARGLTQLFEEQRATATPLTLERLESRGYAYKLRDGFASLFTPYL